MISATARVVFYALVAAASPLVLGATLVMIRSERRRINSIAFLIGFVLGTTLAAVLGLVLGQVAAERIESHETIEGVLAVLLGLALVAAGLERFRGDQIARWVHARGVRDFADMTDLETAIGYAPKVAIEEGVERFMKSDVPQTVCFPAVGVAYRLAVDLLREAS